jgi:hypothetical protein
MNPPRSSTHPNQSEKRNTRTALVLLPESTKKLYTGRVGLAPMVRFLVVKLIYSYLNPIFDMSAVFTTNYSFSGR